MERSQNILYNSKDTKYKENEKSGGDFKAATAFNVGFSIFANSFTSFELILFILIDERHKRYDFKTKIIKIKYDDPRSPPPHARLQISPKRPPNGHPRLTSRK